MTINLSRPTARFGYIAVAVSAILFSAKSIFIKMCYAQGASPMAVMVLRSGFALPFFLGLAFYPWVSKKSLRPKPMGRRDLFVVIGLGLLGYYIASVLDIFGLSFVSASTERLILYIYPSLVVVLSAWFFKMPVPRFMILPLLLSYAGIALSLGSEFHAGSSASPYLGGFLVFLSALTYAVFLIGQGKMVARIGPQRLSAYAMLAASAAVFVHYLIREPIHGLILPGSVYLMAALTSIFCTVIPVYLVGLGLQAIGPGRAAIVSSVGPVSTYALAALILGEAPGMLQVGGLALVLGGSFLLTKGKSLGRTKAIT